jgi:hypothetical protein
VLPAAFGNLAAALALLDWETCREAEDLIYTSFCMRVNGGSAAASGMPCRRRWRAPGGDALSLAPDHVSLGITRPGVRFLDDACPIGALAWNRDDASGTCRKQPRKPTAAKSFSDDYVSAGKVLLRFKKRSTVLLSCQVGETDELIDMVLPPNLLSTNCLYFQLKSVPQFASWSGKLSSGYALLVI